MVSSAWAQGRLDYPQADFGEAMRDLAAAEFHDSLPGSSIQPVEEMALRLMDHGLEILSRLKARAFFSLAQGQPKAGEGQIPILVYNPHPYPIDAVVECEFQLADQNWSGDFTTATAYRGETALPTQLEQELSSLNLDWRKRVVFRARLEPAQMNRFDCRLERIPARPAPIQPAGEVLRFDNGQMQAEINLRTGLLDAYRVNGVDYLEPGALKAMVVDDSPDPWGMTVRRYRRPRGQFRLLSPRRSAWLAGLKSPALAPVRVVEDGEVRTVVEALFGYKDSFLVLRYKLPRQGAEIEVEARVHWNEKDRMLKLSLPGLDARARLLGQVAFGVESLPVNGDEVGAQKWLALVSGERALSVINERTYGADCSGGELRLSLLHSPGYAAHPILDRPILPEDRYSPRHDQGERVFHFWLQGGPANERLETVDREALAHNEKPTALSFFPDGSGSPAAACVRLSDEAVQLTALKKAEDADALVLRLFEPTGQARETRVELPFDGASTTVRLGAFEVLTLCYDLGSGKWTQVNLMEEAA